MAFASGESAAVPPPEAAEALEPADDADLYAASEFEEAFDADVFGEAAVDFVIDEPARASPSPPALMLVVDEEEEADFCTLEAANDRTDLSIVPRQTEPAAEEPPFDPPDMEELLNVEIEEDEEPPFDPMEAEELAPPTLATPSPSAEDGQEELLLTTTNENGRTSLGPARSPVPDSAREQPAPAIRIYLSWDRKEAAQFFEEVAADPRLSRAEIIIARGGLDGAAIRCAAHQRPDLVVIDSNLRGAAMMTSLDRLMHAAGPETRVIILGSVNDVTLLRELAHRGVDEYLMWPVTPAEVAGSACSMFANTDKARVIAVLGARGGIGASTIAHNIAWSVAERQRAHTTLVDLDLSFGAAAFNFKVAPKHTLGDILGAGEAVNDVALERVGVKRSERLTILPAPANPTYSADLADDTAQALIASARRLSSYVVLDLPHVWAPWVRQALVAADEIVLVSSPDIASLRNTDNIAKRIKEERGADPVVVLSMVGVPKRPEVPIKEFAEALGIQPACVVGFEPNVFGAASITGQMLGEIAPESRAAAQVDQLATLLTGREPVDVLHAEPRIFEDAGEEEAVARDAPAGPEDPFEVALVNPFALMSEGDLAQATTSAAELAPLELEPLELLELAPLEPDYLARARAAALDELDAIETARRAPQQHRAGLGPMASAAVGFAITLVAVGAYFFMKLEAAPAPASASTSARIERPAPRPPAPPTPQQMRADYVAATQLIESGDMEGAIARLHRLADAGFATAQHRLAQIYERGEGVAPDLVQARQWTERAAAGGNVSAIHDLGVYYARGEGAPRDDAAALRYFQRAAEFGFVDSQFNLGVFYEEGRGVEANPAEALFWFTLAARERDGAAMERAAALRASLTPFEVEQAEARLAAFQTAPSDPVANFIVEPPAEETPESLESPEVPVESAPGRAEPMQP